MDSKAFSSPIRSSPLLSSQRRGLLSIKRKQIAVTSSDEEEEANGEQPKLLKLLRESSTEARSESMAVATRTPSKRRRSDGLINMANTCYLNSALQALRHTPGFIERLRIIPDTKLDLIGSHSKVQLLRGFLETMERLAQRDSGLIMPENDLEPFDWLYTRESGVRPERLVDILRDGNSTFSNRLQHDAHEFIMYLLNSFEDAEIEAMQLSAMNEVELLEGSPTESKTISNMEGGSKFGRPQHESIRRLFTGVTSQLVRCADCETQTCVKEEWCELGVPMSSSTVGRSLGYAIDRWAAVERLDGDNKYFCECCNYKTEATKKLVFSQLPPILCVHLQRFSHDGSGRPCKINGFLATPQYLRLKRWAGDGDDNKEDEFELYAVIVHQGVSAISGHYYAFVKRLEDERQTWVCYDDTEVEAVSNAEITALLSPKENLRDCKAAGTPYLYFYRRCESQNVS